ncbi:tyrosine-type recombinase/integrase [Actinomadura flavalba]|uniref:tyrosine-type recombinase/integrase n=1 Tax=Actinomadura flavalba TaxID=1120938 RepID=UPI00037D3E78|nr:tyrosine-type recombinase/integrase [Actinomadura flavalba]
MGSSAVPDISSFEPEIVSFRRYLRATNKSPKTIKIYTQAAEKFARFLVAQTDCTQWMDVEQRDVQEHTITILEEHSPGYASNQFRTLQAFLKWWADEEDLPNVMLGMKGPIVPEKLVPVISMTTVQALLKTSEGKSFVARRDMAILLVFIDCGLRLGELVGLKVNDIDLEMKVLYVTGKGRRSRAVPFGHRTAMALDRDLRERSKQKLAHLDSLWLGTQGEGRGDLADHHQVPVTRGRGDEDEPA